VLDAVSIWFFKDVAVYDKSKRAQAAQRSADRLRTEQEAVRLAALFPDLSSLHLDLIEHAGASSTKYRKHVVVASAPALFKVTCSDERCEGGGFELTQDVLRALRMRGADLEGEQTCEGTSGTAPCTHRLNYLVHAVFRAQ
jgi:hypothetical protein